MCMGHALFIIYHILFKCYRVKIFKSLLHDKILLKCKFFTYINIKVVHFLSKGCSNFKNTFLDYFFFIK